MNEDGGSAFPEFTRMGTIQNGMSLRDWFAGMALQIMVKDMTVDHLSPEDLADGAFKISDAMLKERKNRLGKQDI